MADKQDLEKLKNLVGKKIVAIKPKISWDDQIEGVELSFSDGTHIELNSGSSIGCPECDPDGCNTNPLYISSWKEKGK